MIKRVTDDSGRTHEIEIDDDLCYLAPYLMASKKIGIPIWRISKLHGYSVPIDKMEQQQAAIIKDANKKVVITILKKRQIMKKTKGKIEVCGYDDADTGFHFENTLDSFAHELAHVLNWQHNQDRFILEKKLQLAFARLAKKRGYQGYDK